MPVRYETDVVAWSLEQAALLRAGDLAHLDVEHLAEEVEQVGRSEKRELASRMALLLCHLLKWRVQPERRGPSWRGTIKAQRAEIADLFDDAPSLQALLTDVAWLTRTWDRAVGQTMAETGLDEYDLPAACPWSPEATLDPDFLPE